MPQKMRSADMAVPRKMRQHFTIGETDEDGLVGLTGLYPTEALAKSALKRIARRLMAEAGFEFEKTADGYFIGDHSWFVQEISQEEEDR